MYSMRGIWVIGILALTGCSPYVIPKNLTPSVLQNQGIVVISTSSDDISASFASCLLIKAVSENGDKGHCLMLDSSMPKSDFSDHHGHFYILTLNPGSYDVSLFFMNPYLKYTNPHVSSFDVRAGRIIYLGDAHLVRAAYHANKIQMLDHRDRDIALLRQHDPALADQEVEIERLALVNFNPDSDASRQLPGPPSGAAPVLDADYRLRQFTAKDTTGHAIANVPATLISVFDNKGDWDEVSPEQVPAFPMAIPDALRGQVALFYNKHTGWFVVPLGWVVAFTAEGADATIAVAFMAPTGVKDGWMRVSDVSACIDCMYTGADGIVPRAHEVLAKSSQRHSLKPVLTPQPQSLVHISSCATSLRYQLPSSPPVNGVVYLRTDDTEMADTYMALPETQSALSNYISDEFLKTHSKCTAKGQ